jgi:hypothetical protein
MGRRERAGLARAIMIFLATLVAAALLIAVLNSPFQTLVTTSEGLTTTQQAAQGREWIVSFWDALPFIVALLGFIQLVATAAAEGRLPG